jgi:hypothetical protein
MKIRVLHVASERERKPGVSPDGRQKGGALTLLLGLDLPVRWERKGRQLCLPHLPYT